MWESTEISLIVNYLNYDIWYNHTCKYLPNLKFYSEINVPCLQFCSVIPKFSSSKFQPNICLKKNGASISHPSPILWDTSWWPVVGGWGRSRTECCGAWERPISNNGRILADDEVQVWRWTTLLVSKKRW